MLAASSLMRHSIQLMAKICVVQLVPFGQGQLLGYLALILLALTNFLPRSCTNTPTPHLFFSAARYEFSWEANGAASSSPHAPIKCITRQGIIGPGRQFEMIFEYTPQADVPTETFWVGGRD